MKSTDIVLQIQASYNQFTKAEKKVASYVIENKKKVLYMSITDLADACQVGETSVYRFCRTINLQGYQEFKMKLSISLAAEGSIHKRKEEDGDQGLDNFAEQIMKLHTQAIHESYCLLDTSQFQKILQMMNDAKRIFFFGIGDSLLTAEEARNKFIRITNKVVCISDPHIQAMAAAVASEEDLFVIISYSGATKDNIHVAKEAKHPLCTCDRQRSGSLSCISLAVWIRRSASGWRVYVCKDGAAVSDRSFVSGVLSKEL